jgi:hypothetical protein
LNKGTRLTKKDANELKKHSEYIFSTMRMQRRYGEFGDGQIQGLLAIAIRLENMVYAANERRTTRQRKTSDVKKD